MEINVSTLDEMQMFWFKKMLTDEIDNLQGTISNERLFQKGSDTQEQVDMHEENICRLVSFEAFLQDIVKQLP